MIDIDILNRLNAKRKEERLKNLKEEVEKASFPEAVPEYINNHIHTTYSFSPYSPTAAVYAAKAEGLCTAGIIDHDSISGAREFIEAGAMAKIPVTVGMECRVRMDETPFFDRRTNNPDQVGVSYMTIQSVPHNRIDDVNDFFAPYRQKREERNRKMVLRINELLSDINLNYDNDIRPLSMAIEGGSVTERHIMYGLACSFTEKWGKGEGLISYLKNIGINMSQTQVNLLMDIDYPFYEYDLLGVLKSEFIPKIYINADDECPMLSKVADLCKNVDAILCYAYLGDVTASVTGDKKAQKFEDDYLEDVIKTLVKENVMAVTYMPTRNSKEQLDRLRGLCERYQMFQVSGEDINSPRQSFVIEAMKNPEFSNLIESTWKLIEREQCQ